MDTVDSIQKRITKLEQKMLGDEKMNKEAEDEMKPLTELLLQANTRLGTALAQRDSIHSIMKRLDQLNEYLDPMYGEKAEYADTNIKLEMVKSIEPELRENVTLLEEVEKAEPVLGSVQIKDVPGLSSKLEKLAVQMLESKARVDEQSEKVKEMMSVYNSTIAALTAAVVVWDENLTLCEKAAQPKKARE